MNDTLYIWFPRNYLTQSGFLLRDKITLFDSFDRDKRKFYNSSEWAALSYKEMEFPPKEAKYKFPKTQFLVVKQKVKQLLFDYTDYHSDVKIVSQRLLSFLQEKGLTEGYEVAELIVVDKNGEVLTDNPYFALRFGRYSDDLLDLHESTKQRTKVHGSTNYTYPDLGVKSGAAQSIFTLSSLAYRQTFLFKGEVLEEILDKFYKPEIYRASDFPFIYENQYDEELMPLQNKYSITQKTA